MERYSQTQAATYLHHWQPHQLASQVQHAVSHQSSITFPSLQLISTHAIPLNVNMFIVSGAYENFMNSVLAEQRGGWSVYA